METQTEAPVSRHATKVLRSTVTRALAGAAICAGLLLPFPAVAADEATDAVCTVSAHVRHRPGYLLTTTTQGAFASTEESSVSCVGRFGGEDLSPEPGALSMHGTYEGTCLNATGEGRIRIEVRTVDGGRLVLQGPLKVQRSGFVLVGSGQLDKVPFELTFAGGPDPAHPAEDCVTKPLDHVIGAGTITINGSGAES